jgi:hypothetical protein
MPNVSWTLTVQIGGGSSVATSADPVDVEAVDRIEVEVAAGAADQVVEMQPGAAAQVSLLHVRASEYSDNLTFKVSDDAGDTAAVHLTEPQLYTAGAIALFARAPKSLKVSNAGVAPVTLEILVARDATP